MRPSLPAGQYQMPPSSVARGPYQMPASPFENEIQHAPAIYQRLIAESQKRLNAGDIAGARAIWNQMLHYGKFINK